MARRASVPPEEARRFGEDLLGMLRQLGDPLHYDQVVSSSLKARTERSLDRDRDDLRFSVGAPELAPEVGIRRRVRCSVTPKDLEQLAHENVEVEDFVDSLFDTRDDLFLANCFWLTCRETADQPALWRLKRVIPETVCGDVCVLHITEWKDQDQTHMEQFLADNGFALASEENRSSRGALFCRADLSTRRFYLEDGATVDITVDSDLTDFSYPRPFAVATRCEILADDSYQSLIETLDSGAVSQQLQQRASLAPSNMMVVLSVGSRQVFDLVADPQFKADTARFAQYRGQDGSLFADLCELMGVETDSYSDSSADDTHEDVSACDIP